MIENISVVIMAKDADETIAECLDSLKDFKEVININIGSKFIEETVEIKVIKNKGVSIHQEAQCRTQ